MHLFTFKLLRRTFCTSPNLVTTFWLADDTLRTNISPFGRGRVFCERPFRRSSSSLLNRTSHRQRRRRKYAVHKKYRSCETRRSRKTRGRAQSPPRRGRHPVADPWRNPPPPPPSARAGGVPVCCGSVGPMRARGAGPHTVKCWIGRPAPAPQHNRRRPAAAQRVRRARF